MLISTFGLSELHGSGLTGGEFPVVELPLSKSIASRVACLDFLSGGPVRRHAGMCEDEQLLIEALISVGDSAENFDNHASEICGGKTTEVFVGESGTALRLLAAIFSAIPGLRIILRGRGRLLSRPLSPLIQALDKLDGFTPQLHDDGLVITGRCLKSSGPIEIDASISSQFISALMLIGPLTENGIELHLQGNPVSLPYIYLTAHAMSLYGIEPEIITDDYSGSLKIKIGQGSYIYRQEYYCEPCWSSASYFYEYAAITGRKLSMKSAVFADSYFQGDARVRDIFSMLGVVTDFDETGIFLTPGNKSIDLLRLNMSDTPDLVPAIVATCVARGIPFELSGIDHLRHKESDRLAALQNEMEKLGAKLSMKSGIFSFTPGKLHAPACPMETYSDHRMAMAFAPLATLFPLELSGSPDIVNKSFPRFWAQMLKLGIKVC